jgi:hypothetical protein
MDDSNFIFFWEIYIYTDILFNLQMKSLAISTVHFD